MAATSAPFVPQQSAVQQQREREQREREQIEEQKKKQSLREQEKLIEEQKKKIADKQKEQEKREQEKQQNATAAASFFSMRNKPSPSMSFAEQNGKNADGTVRLPVDSYKQEIIAKAEQNDVLIVSGDTGCGKSSRIPIFLQETAHHLAAAATGGGGDSKKNRTIFVTQPRRIAAISLAKRVATETGDVDEHGQPSFVSVGYAIGQDRRFDDNTATHVFCTCGWLVQKLLNDANYAARQISYIVIDEAHERDIDMDLLLFIAKLLLKRFRNRFKLVLMSATLDYGAFENYFPGTTSLVSINMRRFPVQIAYLNALHKATRFFDSDKTTEAFRSAMARGKQKEDPQGLFAGLTHLCHSIVLEKMAAGSTATMLVFLSGIQEIDEAYEQLMEQAASTEKSIEVFVLHSMVEQDSQMAVFQPPSPPATPLGKKLRIVLSTNIAESSVTIPEVSIVVDFGKHKVLCKSEDEEDMMELRVMNVSRAAADQRAGRTGRVCPGTVFRFYTDSDYKYSFPQHNLSEIQLVPLENVVLRFFLLKQANATNMPELSNPLRCIAQLVDPPSRYAVDTAYGRLLRLGALKKSTEDDDDDGDDDVIEWDEKKEEEEGEGEDESFCKRDDADAMEEDIVTFASRSGSEASSSNSSDSTDDYLSSSARFSRIGDDEKVQNESKRVSITPFGSMLVRLPLSFAQSEFVLFGAQFHDYAPHFAIMAAFINNRDIFLNPNHNDTNHERYQSMLRQITAGRRYFARKHGSDLLAAIEIVREMLTFDRRRGNHVYWQWMSRNGLHEKRLGQFLAMVLDVMSRLAQCGFTSAANAYNAITARRFKTSAIDQKTIDAVLPMGPRQSASCSLIVAWALQSNLVISTTGRETRLAATAQQQENEDEEDDDAKEEEDAEEEKEEDGVERRKSALALQEASFLVRMEVQSLQVSGGKPEDVVDAEDLVRRVFAHCVAPLHPDASQSSVSVRKLSPTAPWNGRASLKPLDVDYAAHALRQLLYKQRGVMHYAFGDPKDKRTAVLTISGVVLPRVFEWQKEHDRVFDYPPRSPFHSLVVCNASGKLLSHTVWSTSSEFLPTPTSKVLAVSPLFTKTGRSLRAPLLSIIRDDVHLLFAAVARFTSSKDDGDGAEFCGVRRVDPYDSENKAHRVYSTHFTSGPLEEIAQIDALKSVYGPLASPLVEKLRNWTMQDITSATRSAALLRAMNAMLDFVASEKK